MAAGCSFEYDQLDAIALALHEYAGTFLTEEDFKVVRFVDLEVKASEVTFQAVEQLQLMEPFGAANPEPVLVARDMTFTQIKPTKSPQHMMLTMRNGTGKAIQGAGFGIGERLAEVGAGAAAHVLFRPCLDTWQGYTNLKWHVRDFTLV